MKGAGFIYVSFQKLLVFRLVFPAVMVFVRKNWKTVVCVQKTVVSPSKPAKLHPVMTLVNQTLMKCFSRSPCFCGWAYALT